jgi:hypothetical protein
MVPLKQSRLRVEPLEDRCLPSAAFVLQWNDLLLDVQRLRGQGNQQSARALAIMGAAVYDSVNAINPTHTVYHVDARPFPGVSTASADAAAAQAAHDVAARLYATDVARFDGLLATQLGEVDDGPAEDAGIALGRFVAGEMLAWRANDGSAPPPVVTYTIGTDPGDWQPTPPAYNPIPATPWWPGVTPFALTSGSQFRPGPPPALTSADYTRAFDEVKSIGSINSTTRTQEQTEIARFWADPASNSGVAIWSQITQSVAAAHDLSLAENARLFAQVSVANADAFIASFDVKFTYNFWRPVTAIRAADTDGNPNTAPDSSWTPLISTPNHPSYGSNHSTQSRAAAEALAAFFGTDHVSFTAKMGDVERSYKKFTDAAKEAGKSRVFGGIHWSYDSAAGEQLGRKIGRYVSDHYFQALGDPGDQLPAAAAPLAPVHVTFSAEQVRALFVGALARWQADGSTPSAPHGVEVHVADLGGRTLGKAYGEVIRLDDDGGLTVGTRQTVGLSGAEKQFAETYLPLSPDADGDLGLLGRNGKRK